MSGIDADTDHDVIIIGAGPAGLSAALILGRCCRRVLLCDTGTPRSWAAQTMHGFLSRDGMDPDAFRAVARGDLDAYPNVRYEPFEAIGVDRIRETGFQVEFADASPRTARKILLATGVFDQLPAIPGVQAFFGVSVHPCPYCDGWEARQRRVAIYGKGQRGFEMARALTAWSADLLLCTNGRATFTPAQRQALRLNGVRIATEAIDGLVGESGQLRAIRFVGGRVEPCDAMFFDTPSYPQSRLAERLGCQMTRAGGVLCGDYEESSIPGVFAAGNITKGVQLAIVAAAEGARAAFGINRSLTREDFARRAADPASRARIAEPPAHALRRETAP